MRSKKNQRREVIAPDVAVSSQNYVPPASTHELKADINQTLRKIEGVLEEIDKDKDGQGGEKRENKLKELIEELEKQRKRDRSLEYYPCCYLLAKLIWKMEGPDSGLGKYDLLSQSINESEESEKNLKLLIKINLDRALIYLEMNDKEMSRCAFAELSEQISDICKNKKSLLDVKTLGLIQNAAKQISNLPKEDRDTFITALENFADQAIEQGGHPTALAAYQAVRALLNCCRESSEELWWKIKLLAETASVFVNKHADDRRSKVREQLSGSVEAGLLAIKLLEEKAGESDGTYIIREAIFLDYRAQELCKDQNPENAEKALSGILEKINHLIHQEKSISRDVVLSAAMIYLRQSAVYVMMEKENEAEKCCTSGLSLLGEFLKQGNPDTADPAITDPAIVVSFANLNLFLVWLEFRKGNYEAAVKGCQSVIDEVGSCKNSDENTFILKLTALIEKFTAELMWEKYGPAKATYKMIEPLFNDQSTVDLRKDASHFWERIGMFVGEIGPSWGVERNNQIDVEISLNVIELLRNLGRVYGNNKFWKSSYRCFLGAFKICLFAYIKGIFPNADSELKLLVNRINEVEAETKFDQILSKAYYWLAKISFSRRNLEEAIGYINQALKIKDSKKSEKEINDINELAFILDCEDKNSAQLFQWLLDPFGSISKRVPAEPAYLNAYFSVVQGRSDTDRCQVIEISKQLGSYIEDVKKSGKQNTDIASILKFSRDISNLSLKKQIQKNIVKFLVQEIECLLERKEISSDLVRKMAECVIQIIDEVVKIFKPAETKKLLFKLHSICFYTAKEGEEKINHAKEILNNAGMDKPDVFLEAYYHYLDNTSEEDRNFVKEKWHLLRSLRFKEKTHEKILLSGQALIKKYLGFFDVQGADQIWQDIRYYCSKSIPWYDQQSMGSFLLQYHANIADLFKDHERYVFFLGICEEVERLSSVGPKQKEQIVRIIQELAGMSEGGENGDLELRCRIILYRCGQKKSGVRIGEIINDCLIGRLNEKTKTHSAEEKIFNENKFVNLFNKDALLKQFGLSATLNLGTIKVNVQCDQFCGYPWSKVDKQCEAQFERLIEEATVSVKKMELKSQAEEWKELLDRAKDKKDVFKEGPRRIKNCLDSENLETADKIWQDMDKAMEELIHEGRYSTIPKGQFENYVKAAPLFFNSNTECCLNICQRMVTVYRSIAPTVEQQTKMVDVGNTLGLLATHFQRENNRALQLRCYFNLYKYHTGNLRDTRAKGDKSLIQETLVTHLSERVVPYLQQDEYFWNEFIELFNVQGSFFENHGLRVEPEDNTLKFGVDSAQFSIPDDFEIFLFELGANLDEMVSQAQEAAGKKAREKELQGCFVANGEYHKLIMLIELTCSYELRSWRIEGNNATLTLSEKYLTDVDFSKCFDAEDPDQCAEEEGYRDSLKKIVSDIFWRLVPDLMESKSIVIEWNEKNLTVRIPCDQITVERVEGVRKQLQSPKDPLQEELTKIQQIRNELKQIAQLERGISAINNGNMFSFFKIPKPEITSSQPNPTNCQNGRNKVTITFEGASI